MAGPTPPAARLGYPPKQREPDRTPPSAEELLPRGRRGEIRPLLTQEAPGTGVQGSLGPVGTEQGSGPPHGGCPAGAQAGRALAGAGFRPGVGLAPPESSLKLLLSEAPVLPAPLGSGGSWAAAPPSSEPSPSPPSSGLPGPVLAPRAAGWAVVTQEGSRPCGREASRSACASTLAPSVYTRADR